MRDWLIRLVISFIVLGYDFYEFLRDSILLALGRDRKIFAERKGGLADQREHRRAVVVAIRPSGDALPFLLNLLKALEEHKFFVLAVSTKVLPDDIAAEILPHCHWLIERYPIGRDFGSYKLGIQWMSSRPALRHIDTLAIVNDSVFYPARTAALVGELLEQKGGWLCMFENTEALRHAQSFFLVFRDDVLQSRAFVDFWQRYRPYSSRRHAIRRGEVGLTELLDKAGFIPAVLFSSTRICQDVDSRLHTGQPSESFERVMWSTLNRTQVGMTMSDAKLMMDSPMAALSFIAMLAERRGPTHALGLLCNVLYNAPIKRDISYRGHQLIVDVLRLCQGYSAEEREAMARDLWRKGPPITLIGGGLARVPLWALYSRDRI